eukprot:TRINITY_DN75432_c0_g1_i1.p1 TRINITY_DN75432_c0_g1~~TRINITY_DN75432_c0_g1_i1.p1  ORF type:complete len:233 (+),score=36.17 TRINITY_DN75432_c0_g1_i1:67-765(+)
MLSKTSGAMRGMRGTEQATSTRVLFSFHPRGASLLGRRSGLRAACAGLAMPLLATQLWNHAQCFLSMRQEGLREEAVLSARASANGTMQHRGETFALIYERRGGPQQMGRLLIWPHGPSPPSPGDVAECLDAVNRWSAENVFREDFVAVFDISQMVWPSATKIPAHLTAIRERLPSKELRDKTQAFAIVKRESFWFNSIIDAVLLMARPVTIPIFASSQEEASQSLQQRLQR